MNEKIELLPVDLLDQNRSVVVELKKLAASLGLDFGWHYLLDLTWTIQQLGPVEGCRILDAGAGTGILQWYLAEHGAQVISVDRYNRSLLPVRFRRRYHCQGLRPPGRTRRDRRYHDPGLRPGNAAPVDLAPTSRVLFNDFANLFRAGTTSWPARFSSLARDFIGLFVSPLKADKGHPVGKVWIYNQDLADLADLADQSIDAIVSISALEHNPPEDLPVVLAELVRVLKPGGPLIATLTASASENRWHAPSAGWCYSAESLQQLFSLPSQTPHNYAEYERLFSDLRNCSELRDNLAGFYAKSDQNGMPWGIWNPQYMPVGVIKIKQTQSGSSKKT